MTDSYCLKLSVTKEVDLDFTTFFLSNYLPIPETQAEQIVILLNKNKSVEIFTGYDYSDLEKFQKILGKKVNSEIIKI